MILSAIQKRLQINYLLERGKNRERNSVFFKALITYFIYLWVFCDEVNSSEFVYTSFQANTHANENRGHDVNRVSFDTLNKSYKFGPMIFQYEVNCSPDLSCIFSDFLNFCVDKENMSVGGRWSCRDIKFRVVRKLDVELLGESLDTFDILGKSKNGLWYQRYLYSKESGLVSFSATLVSGNGKKRMLVFG